MDGIRLQKFLSERGAASRRGAAEIIAAGRVQVNGRVITEAGHRMDPSRDRVELDGKAVDAGLPDRLVIALYKPRGYICSRRAQAADARTVYDLLPPALQPLQAVGRLDKDSEGLLLMSNDGDFIQQMTHPRHEHEKVYEVDVAGRLDHKALALLRSRLEIDGYCIQPVKIEIIAMGSPTEPHRLRFTLREGRNRQIRKMCDAAGLRVDRLVRTKVGPYTLADLSPGTSKRV